MKLIYPLRSVRITQRFGENPASYAQDGLAGHNGVDFGCPTGTELLASANGVVTEVGNQGAKGYGKYFRIKTNNGLQLTYGHCSAILVIVGDSVTAGQVVAKSGNTGRSTGPHLHFGVREYDSSGNIKNYGNGFKGAIDPLPLFMNTTSTNPAVPPEDPELAEAKLWAQEHKVMGMTSLDKPILRQDALRVVYRLYQLIKH